MEPTNTPSHSGLPRRAGGIIAVGIILGAVAGGIALTRAKPVYASAATVLVNPVGQEPLNLQTEAELVRSTQTSVDVGALLDGSGLPTVASVDVPADTSVLVIRFEAATPADAQAGARAFAEIYLRNREEAAGTAISRQISALNTKIAELETQAGDLNRRIAAARDGSPDVAILSETLATVTAQRTSLLTRVNDLATTTINPGRVIGEADRPSRPIRPVAWMFLTVGAGTGLLLGVFVALLRERLSRRVRHAADVTVRTGISVLAELPDDPVQPDGTAPPRIYPPHHVGGRAFHRLRNEVVASLAPGERTLLVTAASPGSASTVVAANLAAALARADNDVIIVGANVPEIGSTTLTLARLFDVADVPGLTDVLAGRTPLGHAVQRAARTPRLHVVTPGGTASAGGLLQAEAVRVAIQVLRQQAHFLVVEAPSAASGADAQSLAGLADAAIMVVEAGDTHHAQVADAAVQLQRVGTRLLGAVIVPPVMPVDPDLEVDLQPYGRTTSDDASDHWLSDPRAAMNAPTTAIRQVNGQRPSTPAQP
jgi:Mrp family chromosome partitioning ATPase